MIARSRSVLLAVLAFAVTSALVGRLVPWPEEYGLRAKLEWFAERKDEFDVVFLGSSRVFRGVDPRIVDRELLEAGLPTRSCNLAIGGMTGFECDFFLKELLALEPRRLELVVLEAQPWDPSSYFLGNTFSSRSIFWHGPAQTGLALASVAATDAPLGPRVEMAWTHLRLCAMKLANVGQGPRIALDLVGADGDPFRRALSVEALQAGQGYQSLEELASGDTTRRAGKTPAEDPGFAAEMQRIPAENDAPADLARYNFAALRAQREAVAKAGVRLAWLVPPSNEGHAEVLELARRGEAPPLLDYNDPRRHPRYFDADWRYDRTHLNRAGGEDFSARLATDLAPLVREARSSR